tara:strand:+ start:244 stop:456 length:213 start_codon:yes stop_codon:yes gene_type:complete
MKFNKNINMRTARNKIVDLGEYIINIDYDGDGRLNVSVLDELGGEIESLFISNSEDNDNDVDDINTINLN